MNKNTRAVSRQADTKKPQMRMSETDMPKKSLSEKEALTNTPPLSGWALMEETLSIEEAERERLMQEIPYFREQAIHTMAYWISLSRRIEALSRTRQLLALLPPGADSSAPPSHAQSGLTKND